MATTGLAPLFRCARPTPEYDTATLRHMAFGIEEALSNDARGVSFERPAALIISKILLDFADRVDRDE